MISSIKILINIPAILVVLLHLWSREGNYDHRQQLLSWTFLPLDFPLAYKILWGICEPGQIFLMITSQLFLNECREHLVIASILGYWQRNLKENTMRWLDENQLGLLMIYRISTIQIDSWTYYFFSFESCLVISIAD